MEKRIYVLAFVNWLLFLLGILALNTYVLAFVNWLLFVLGILALNTSDFYFKYVVISQLFFIGLMIATRLNK